ncbi:MAG TPA: GGDEF domain-containing response regulator [Solirubrobacteraceae bacterium]
MSPDHEHDFDPLRSGALIARRARRPGTVGGRFARRVDVLLVEDDPSYGDLLTEQMRYSWGDAFALRRCDTLDEAMRIVRDVPPDCVLLDLRLPDSRGLESIGALRDAAPDVPIVVLTSLDDEIAGLEAMQAGAQDYLLKAECDGQLIGRAVRYAVERARFERQLDYQALHDSLTGLPNRLLLLDHLELALRRAEGTKASVAALFVDIDRFKLINDSLGHGAGDRILIETAQALEEIMRPGDTVGRFGGDEFAVVCDGVDGEHDVGQIAERIAQALADPVVIAGREVFVSASVGIALSRHGGRGTAEDLVRSAEVALDRAKEHGGSRWELFDSDMQRRALRRLEMEHDLYRAIERDELRLLYQPQVSCTDGLLAGVEALVRWQHPTRGLIGPLEFVPLAEETGLITAIGAWVLEQACGQSRRWSEQRPDAALKVSVNLSVLQLTQPDLVEAVTSVLAASRVDPAELCFEVTETTMMRDPAATLATLVELKRLGVQVGIDDFGTGYSSLAYLSRLPIDLLKIDRSFIVNLDEPDNERIVSALISLSHALGLTVIAEGVERPQHVAALTGLGCDLAQGFLFGKALPASDISGFLHETGQMLDASRRQDR